MTSWKHVSLLLMASNTRAEHQATHPAVCSLWKEHLLAPYRIISSPDQTQNGRKTGLHDESKMLSKYKMSACLQRECSKQIVLAVLFSLAVLPAWWGFTSNNIFLVRDPVLIFFVPVCTWECYSCSQSAKACSPTNVSTSLYWAGA